MLIGSLVELHVGLHLCLCFSPLEKLVLKYGLTPPQYLLDTLLSVELLKFYSYRNPDSSSIPGGLIKNAPASSIAPWHLVDQSSFCSWIWFLVARYLLDTSAVNEHFLDTYLDSFLDISRYLICRALLKALFKPRRAIRFSFHSISLSIALCFLSQTLSSHSNFIPQRFLQDFSSFSSLGKLLISHSSCISCFWDLGFEVFENFRVFSKLLSYSWNFGMGFHLNEFKTSYTASR